MGFYLGGTKDIRPPPLHVVEPPPHRGEWVGGGFHYIIVLLQHLFTLLGGGISKDICDFLTREFPSNSEIDLELQNVLRDNLYARTVPCTYKKTTVSLWRRANARNVRLHYPYRQYTTSGWERVNWAYLPILFLKLFLSQTLAKTRPTGPFVILLCLTPGNFTH